MVLYVGCVFDPFCIFDMCIFCTLTPKRVPYVLYLYNIASLESNKKAL